MNLQLTLSFNFNFNFKKSTDLYLLLGQIRGQVNVCRAWNALPNNVEHKVEAIMEPFRSPAGDRTWVL